MSNEKICRRCGRELSAADFAEGFCLVCGEPVAAAAETVPPAAAPEAAEEERGPERVEWRTEGDYVLCPVCGASYFADEAPAKCERCAAESLYTDTIWEKPDLPGHLSLVHSSGQSITLTDGLPVGRQHTDCLRDDRYVSRLHATILVRNGAVLIRDEDSDNGTRVNGAKLQPHKAHPLRAGDVVMLDEQRFEVRLPGADERL